MLHCLSIRKILTRHDQNRLENMCRHYFLPRLCCVRDTHGPLRKFSSILKT